MALVILPIDLKPAGRKAARHTRRKNTNALNERRQRLRAAMRVKEML